MQVIREINVDVPISSDTVNPEHLIPVFWEYVLPEDRADILKQNENTIIPLLANASSVDEDHAEWLGDFLLDIMDALERRGAENGGLVFGTHESDAACFGFWSGWTD